ncbi:MAG: hypothetical protein KME21_27740 [Desmonostoc vinosum HA7617-LM4]|nr:hypothetical protein [Desmonostoc vinosum HA7617-LM4]
MNLPKRQLQRLYNVLQNTIQNHEAHLNDPNLDPQGQVKYTRQSFEDCYLLVYLDWVLKQND